jgi:hypothetical protein
MKNEIYGEVLAHNICCLVQSIYGLRIQPEFSTQIDMRFDRR